MLSFGLIFCGYWAWIAGAEAYVSTNTIDIIYNIVGMVGFITLGTASTVISLLTAYCLVTERIQK